METLSDLYQQILSFNKGTHDQIFRFIYIFYLKKAINFQFITISTTSKHLNKMWHKDWAQTSQIYYDHENQWRWLTSRIQQILMSDQNFSYALLMLSNQHDMPHMAIKKTSTGWQAYNFHPHFRGKIKHRLSTQFGMVVAFHTEWHDLMRAKFSFTDCLKTIHVLVGLKNL